MKLTVVVLIFLALAAAGGFTELMEAKKPTHALVLGCTAIVCGTFLTWWALSH